MHLHLSIDLMEMILDGLFSQASFFGDLSVVESLEVYGSRTYSCEHSRSTCCSKAAKYRYASCSKGWIPPTAAGNCPMSVLNRIVGYRLVGGLPVCLSSPAPSRYSLPLSRPPTHAGADNARPRPQTDTHSPQLFRRNCSLSGLDQGVRSKAHLSREEGISNADRRVGKCGGRGKQPCRV